MENFTEFDKKRRRSLLPWWIKGYCWIFQALAIIATIFMILSILGFQIQFEFYGIKSSAQFSLKKVTIYLIFLLHGFTGYSLWFEKKYAVSLGIINAMLGITICLIVMFLKMFNDYFSFRLELVLLILFLIRLRKIEPQWK